MDELLWRQLSKLLQRPDKTLKVIRGEGREALKPLEELYDWSEMAARCFDSSLA
jgi:hypothetical protein